MCTRGVMRRRRLQPTEPNLDNKRTIERLTRVLNPPARVALEPFFPLRRRGHANLPEAGALILSNHVSLVDPMFTIAAAARPIHFLATAAAMQDPVLGRVLQIWGSVPKKKFSSDVKAIRALKNWADLGAFVGSYPEGERSWDGELMPLLPGVEALVRLLKLPVIPVRILNAHRVMPRWAHRRRRGAVTIEFGPPRSFERKTPPAEIRAWLESELRVDPHDERLCSPVRGRDLALGVENPLFRCPDCFAWDSLRASGDEVRCSACARTWRVDTRNCLLGRLGGGRSQTLIEARARIRDRCADEGYVVEARRFEREGVVATSEICELLDVAADDPRSLGHGRLELRADALRIVRHTGEELLHLPLTELTTTVIEFARQLTFRTKDGALYEAVLPRESPLKWLTLVERWRSRACA